MGLANIGGGGEQGDECMHENSVIGQLGGRGGKKTYLNRRSGQALGLGVSRGWANVCEARKKTGMGSKRM